MDLNGLGNNVEVGIDDRNNGDKIEYEFKSVHCVADGRK